MSIDKIEHVVVLMFENRSFDHLFGGFPGANGLFDNGVLKPDVYNLAQPKLPPGEENPKQKPFPITPAVQLGHDCFHDFIGMMPELFGPNAAGWAGGKPLGEVAPTYPPTNGGFYSTVAYNVVPPTLNGPQCLAYYEHGSLQVLHTLASEFVLCDNWFCDAPGDTLLNRLFMHSAQAVGRLDDSIMQFSVPTIFDRVEAAGRSWKMYAPWEEVDGGIESNAQIDSRFFDSTIGSPNTQRPVTELASDLAAGTLPFYSFVMCWLPPPWPSSARETSMHPVSDIRAGENYLAAVYNAFRASPCWENTLLIVTFDENGGLYDHVPPPPAAAPNDLIGSVWDSHRGIECSFDFTLLGPRVPVLLISPWLCSGVASTPLQNTSILRTLKDMMGSPKLTARDEEAPALDPVFAEFGLDEPRTDCPVTIAGYADFPYADGDLSKTYVAPTGKADLTHEDMPKYMRDMARLYHPVASEEISRNYSGTGGAPGRTRA